MKEINPAVFGLACGTGVFLSNYFGGRGELTGALLAGGITGALVALVLYLWQKRRG